MERKKKKEKEKVSLETRTSWTFEIVARIRDKRWEERTVAKEEGEGKRNDRFSGALTDDNPRVNIINRNECNRAGQQPSRGQPRPCHETATTNGHDDTQTPPFRMWITDRDECQLQTPRRSNLLIDAFIAINVSFTGLCPRVKGFWTFAFGKLLFVYATRM